MISTLTCVLFLLFQIPHGTKAQEDKQQTGQCVGSNELESLRYHVYSELSESKKEIDTLRNDLQYWQNTTLSILKKYMLEKDMEQSSCDFNAFSEKLNDVQLTTGKYCNSTQDVIVEVREIMESYQRSQSEELREIISELNTGQLPLGTFLNPASSCKYLPINSSSGNYWIQNADTGYASLEYCDMTRRCCNNTGGWMRVAYLDMTDPSHHCPVGFRNIDSPVRTCGRPGSGCYSTTYTVNGISYSQVCGRIKAYQYYSPNAFHPYYKNRAFTIDDIYVDGVSLTHGQNPRKHIWTFANAIDEIHSNEWVCPCTKTDSTFTGVVPPFIGSDYFCDTGSRYRYQAQFYSNDPLWDGNGCGGSSTCCQFNNPPWFCKQLPQPTTDDIELRLCADENYVSDDTMIEQVELYVQ